MPKTLSVNQLSGLTYTFFCVKNDGHLAMLFICYFNLRVSFFHFKLSSKAALTGALAKIISRKVTQRCYKSTQRIHIEGISLKRLYKSRFKCQDNKK
jgi:hypothetical protein